MQIESVYLFFFGIFGLAPVEIKTNRRKNLDSNPKVVPIKYLRSRIGLLYNIWIIAVIFGLNFMYFSNISYREVSDRTSMSTNLRLAMRIARAVTVFSIWINSIWKQSKMAKILNDLAKINAKMTNIFINTKRCPKKYDVSYLLVAIQIILACGNFCTHYLSNNGFNKRILTSIYDSVICLHILQYAIILRVITIVYGDMYVKLSELVDSHGAFQRYVIFVSAREEKYSTITSKVAAIRQSYAVLSDLCDDVSQLYGVPMLHSLAYAFGVIVYYTYYTILHSIISPHEKSFIYTIDAMIPLSNVIFVVTTICISANSTLTQISKFINMIYRLLEVGNLNRKVQTELEVFALEVSHREVTFQACNIFSIDCGLLRSIFSVSMTYLILLLQFNTNQMNKTSYRQ